MNLGVEDATLLARWIAGDEVDRYDRERRRAGRAAIRRIRAQTRLMTTRNPAARIVRRTLVPALLGLKVVEKRFVARALGLGNPA